MKTTPGIVVSTKMEKTATVLIETVKSHPLYKKIIRHQKKVHAHNSPNAQEGDKVLITQSRPLSKTKRWRIVKIVKK